MIANSQIHAVRSIVAAGLTGYKGRPHDSLFPSFCASSRGAMPSPWHPAFIARGGLRVTRSSHPPNAIKAGTSSGR